MRWLGSYAPCVIILTVATTVWSQVSRPRTASQPASAAVEKDMIQLTLPANVEMKVLVEYVTRRLGINVLYDEAALKKRIAILSPSKIPKDSLLGLLHSVLKMNGLMMVDSDQPGWKKIVPVTEAVLEAAGPVELVLTYLIYDPPRLER